MVATAIFLDRGVALRALLCISRNPISGFRVVFAFLQPHLDQGARSWLMVCHSTSKTKAMFASAGNGGNNPKKISLFDSAFDSILAIWGWAPFEILFIVHVGPH